MLLRCERALKKSPDTTSQKDEAEGRAPFGHGLPDRIRTCGLKSRSLALYPAGLRVDDGISQRSLLYHKKREK